MANRPWYYVKGRRDLMDQQISKRREKAAFRNEVNNKINDYFNKWQFQNQLIEHWKMSDAKFIKKTKVPICLRVPFDLDYDPSLTKKEKTQIENKINSTNSKLKCKLKELIELENKVEHILDKERFIIDRIEQVLDMKKSLDDCRDHWTIKESKLFYTRFARDKLRLKAFLALEELNFYQMMIEALIHSSIDDIIRKEEAQDLNSIVQQSLQMIKVYSDLNHERNAQYSLLYNEEAESFLLEHESCWSQEKQIWSVVVDQILETYFSIFRTKLEESLQSQEMLFPQREELFQSLNQFVENIAKDDHLQCLINKEVNDYFLEQDEI